MASLVSEGCGHLSRQGTRRVVAPHHSGHRFGRAKQPERHDYGGFSVLALGYPTIGRPDCVATASKPLTLTQFWYGNNGFFELTPKFAATHTRFLLNFSRISQMKW